MVYYYSPFKVRCDHDLVCVQADSFDPLPVMGTSH